MIGEEVHNTKISEEVIDQKISKGCHGRGWHEAVEENELLTLI